MEATQMAEEQAELNKAVGTQEPERVSLQPAEVVIVNVQIEPTTKSKKVVFEVKHPDKEETIKLSSVAYLDGDNVKITGTWLNMDKEENIQKGSALAILLNHIGANTPLEAKDKKCHTRFDKDGKYLVFKAY